jgi:hypothetical protein
MSTTSKLTEGDGREIKPFAAVLREIRNGDLLVQLAETLNELVLAVEDARKVGTMTVVIKVAPVDPEGGEGLKVTVDVKLAKPRQTQAGLFYAVDGNLQRNHPGQPQLPLQVVSGGRPDTADPFAGENEGA